MTEPLAAPTEHRVESAGVTLAVREYGDPGRPHVVLVHGYPDDQSLWDGVVARLPDLHVVTYDVRGAGRSGAPAALAGYRTDALLLDLLAVLAATVPAGEPVHLVGHDWGSIQGWSFVEAAGSDPRLRGRLASFTSISGPSIDQVGELLRQPRGRAWGLARQLLRSWYVLAYQVPRLPGWMWRRRHPLTPLMVGLVAAQGGRSGWTPELGRTAANGVHLYRANIPGRIRRPRPVRVELPVLLVVARRDRFVGPAYLGAVARYCPDLRRVELDAPHWSPYTHPAELAALLREQVAGH